MTRRSEQPAETALSPPAAAIPHSRRRPRHSQFLTPQTRLFICPEIYFKIQLYFLHCLTPRVLCLPPPSTACVCTRRTSPAKEDAPIEFASHPTQQWRRVHVRGLSGTDTPTPLEQQHRMFQNSFQTLFPAIAGFRHRLFAQPKNFPLRRISLEVQQVSSKMGMLVSDCRTDTCFWVDTNINQVINIAGNMAYCMYP